MDELEVIDLRQLFEDNLCNVEWERVDFVDPPYCWSVVGRLSIDGYEFGVDGTETVGYCDIDSVVVTTPGGIIVQLK